MREFIPSAILVKLTIMYDDFYSQLVRESTLWAIASKLTIAHAPILRGCVNLFSKLVLPDRLSYMVVSTLSP